MSEPAEIVGKPISLINTPTHQRYWLPNRDFWYDLEIKGRWEYHRIVHNETQTEQLFADGSRMLKFDRRHKNHQRLSLYAQELAAKRFPRPQPREDARETVFYNVICTDEPAKALMPSDNAFLNVAQSFKANITIRTGKTYEIIEIKKEEQMSRSYWNVIDTKNPDKFLMAVSTSQYVIASHKAADLRREFPSDSFEIVKTDMLAPWKREAGK